MVGSLAASAGTLVDNIAPILFRWKDGGTVLQPSETEFEETQVAICESVSEPAYEFEIVDGVAVRRQVARMVERAIVDELPMLDDTGKAVRDADGQPVLHRVPRTALRRRPKLVAHQRPGTRTHAGFKTQDIKRALDAAGLDFAVWGLDDKNDPQSRQWLRPDQLVPILWEAMREARRDLAALRAKLGG